MFAWFRRWRRRPLPVKVEGDVRVSVCGSMIVAMAAFRDTTVIGAADGRIYQLMQNNIGDMEVREIYRVQWRG